MKKYFCYVVFLVFSAVTMQESNKSIIEAIDNVPHWLQLSENLHAINHDTQLATSKQFSKHYYNYDKKLKSFFVTSKKLPPKPVYTIISENNAQCINFDVVDKDNNHITSSFPSPFDRKHNIVIGPNKNNYMIINDNFYDLENKVVTKIPLKDSTQKPVALHPTKKIFCMSYRYLSFLRLDHLCKILLYGLENDITQSSDFTHAFIPEIYPHQKRPFRRIFFGPDIQNIPTIWIRTRLDEIEHQHLTKHYNQVGGDSFLVEAFAYDKKKEIYDYFCNSDNPEQLITFIAPHKTACYSNEKPTEELEMIFITNSNSSEYSKKNINPETLAPTFYMGSAHMLPHIITQKDNKLQEVDTHNPSYQLEVVPKKPLATKTFFLKQMHALVLFNTLTQLATHHCSEQEKQQFVNLMRAHSDKYKILLHAKFLPHEQQEKVNNFLKKLQEKF